MVHVWVFFFNWLPEDSIISFREDVIFVEMSLSLHILDIATVFYLEAYASLKNGWKIQIYEYCNHRGRQTWNILLGNTNKQKQDLNNYFLKATFFFFAWWLMSIDFVIDLLWLMSKDCFKEKEKLNS